MYLSSTAYNVVLRIKQDVLSCKITMTPRTGSSQNLDKKSLITTTLKDAHASAPYISSSFFELYLRHCHHTTTTLLFDDHDRRPRPLRKLPRHRLLGLGPQRRHRGAHLTTSSVDSATVFRRALRLCRCRPPRLCTLLIAPRRSLRRPETQRFRSIEALAAKPLFTSHQWGLPGHEDTSLDLTK